MGTTPILALRYPDSNDAPNGPLQMRNLAEDVEDAVAAVTAAAPAWTEYTPGFTATDINPAVGPGGFRVGAWTRAGRTIHGRFKIQYGSGHGDGSGTLMFGLPVPGAANGSSVQNAVVGTAIQYRGVNTSEPGVLVSVATSGTFQTCTLRLPGGVGAYAGNGQLMHDGYAFQGQFTYEAATA